MSKPKSTAGGKMPGGGSELEAQAVKQSLAEPEDLTMPRQMDAKELEQLLVDFYNLKCPQGALAEKLAKAGSLAERNCHDVHKLNMGLKTAPAYGNSDLYSVWKPKNTKPDLASPQPKSTEKSKRASSKKEKALSDRVVSSSAARKKEEGMRLGNFLNDTEQPMPALPSNAAHDAAAGSSKATLGGAPGDIAAPGSPNKSLQRAPHADKYDTAAMTAAAAEVRADNEGTKDTAIPDADEEVMQLTATAEKRAAEAAADASDAEEAAKAAEEAGHQSAMANGLPVDACEAVSKESGVAAAEAFMAGRRAGASSTDASALARVAAENHCKAHIDACHKAIEDRARKQADAESKRNAALAAQAAQAAQAAASASTSEAATTESSEDPPSASAAPASTKAPPSSHDEPAATEQPQASGGRYVDKRSEQRLIKKAVDQLKGLKPGFWAARPCIDAPKGQSWPPPPPPLAMDQGKMEFLKQAQQATNKPGPEKPQLSATSSVVRERAAAHDKEIAQKRQERIEEMLDCELKPKLAKMTLEQWMEHAANFDAGNASKRVSLSDMLLLLKAVKVSGGSDDNVVPEMLKMLSMKSTHIAPSASSASGFATVTGVDYEEFFLRARAGREEAEKMEARKEQDEKDKEEQAKKDMQASFQRGKKAAAENGEAASEKKPDGEPAKVEKEEGGTKKMSGLDAFTAQAQMSFDSAAKEEQAKAEEEAKKKKLEEEEENKKKTEEEKKRELNPVIKATEPEKPQEEKKCCAIQ